MFVFAYWQCHTMNVGFDLSDECGTELNQCKTANGDSFVSFAAETLGHRRNFLLLYISYSGAT